MVSDPKSNQPSSPSEKAKALSAAFDAALECIPYARQCVDKREPIPDSLKLSIGFFLMSVEMATYNALCCNDED